jgi:hypothetical protein
MKKTGMIIVRVLVSFFLISGVAMASITDNERVPRQQNKCENQSEAVSIAFGLQSLGVDELVICSRLTELYGAGTKECILIISLSSILREIEGNIPLKYVKEIVYQSCVENAMHKGGNARR